MNREIKFRAWEKKNKGMLFSFEFPLDFMNHSLADHGVDGRLEDYEWMQYTGLTDKSGKEIYEGDVVKSKGYHGEDICAPVIWVNEDSGWYVGFKEKGQCSITSLTATSELEAIGNIYSNPELLK